MLGAIKLYREIHVCSMEEAKEGIKQIEQLGF
jgi:ribosomal protein L7/L12